MILKQSTVYTRLFLMVQSADHVSALTGAAPAVNLSKAGAAFGVASNSPATEIANGWYKIALSGADTSITGDLAYHITATSGDPTDFVDQVQTFVFSDLNIDANGNVSIASSYKKNQSAILPFIMTAGNPPIPATGLTVAAQRSLAGAGFAPCANAPIELSNGAYYINLAATDTNASVVLYRFTAVGANDQDITLYTQP